jgi:hypothetical protein
MKNKYLLILFVIGVIITIFGALFKITHWEIGPLNGTIILTIGMLFEVIAAVLFIIKLLSNKKNNFLNQ